MKFTQQQEDIFNSTESIILIKAFAGAGKTTTLIEFAKRRPKNKFLYLAFNSSVVENAKGKFPSNVKIMTPHSLAYKEFGHLFEDKIKKNLKTINVINLLNLDKRNKLHLKLAKTVLDTVINYTNSDYKVLNDAVPLKNLINRDDFISYCERLWDAMIDNTNDFPCTHDAYLKLYQLSQPYLNYDYILYDEAQDANPVIVDIISKQVVRLQTKLVIVGDEHQAIYGFRNAINSLSKFKHDKEYALSKSFRFGKNIAFGVNAILQVMKGESILVEGADHEDNIVKSLDRNKKIAIISRTNACLFLKALEAIEKNKTIHFISGIQKYNFYKIKDVDNLYSNKHHKIVDPYIREFENYASFVHLAENTEDNEMLFLKKIVDKYHGKIEVLMEKINCSIVGELDADVVLTTAHKSKGLEFENVFLCNDFARFIDSKGNIILRNWKEEEINILYVATSRATKCLQGNSMLNNVIKYYQAGLRDNMVFSKNKNDGKTVYISNIDNKWDK